MTSFIKLIIESSYIDPSEATSDIKAIGTLVNNKRNVCFLVKGANSASSWKEIESTITREGFKQMYVKGNPNDAYVVYKPGSENKAKRLKDIAEKYGGYLSYQATEEDTREIGKLLNYDPKKVEEYIKRGKDRGDIKEQTSIIKEIEFNSKKADKYLSEYIGGKDNKYIFNTGEEGKPGIDYEVLFVEHENGSGLFERIYKPVGKGFEQTNENKAVKINATVMEITLKFMDRNKDWNELIISPIDSRRYSIVKRFVDNSIPKGKYFVDSEEGIIKISRNFKYSSILANKSNRKSKIKAA